MLAASPLAPAAENSPPQGPRQCHLRLIAGGLGPQNHALWRNFEPLVAALFAAAPGIPAALSTDDLIYLMRESDRRPLTDISRITALALAHPNADVSVLAAALEVAAFTGTRRFTLEPALKAAEASRAALDGAMLLSYSRALGALHGPILAERIRFALNHPARSTLALRALAGILRKDRGPAAERYALWEELLAALGRTAHGGDDGVIASFEILQAALIDLESTATHGALSAPAAALLAALITHPNADLNALNKAMQVLDTLTLMRRVIPYGEALPLGRQLTMSARLRLGPPALRRGRSGEGAPSGFLPSMKDFTGFELRLRRASARALAPSGNAHRPQ